MKRPKWTAAERGARRWILRRWKVVPSNGVSPSDIDILQFICARTGWEMPTKRGKRTFMLRFWNHENGLPLDQQLPKRERTRRARRQLYFYDTKEWQRIRYEALKLHGAKCQCCGAGREHGIVLHVDHIKPRSKYPELELELSNLQVLCEACNMGKLHRDETDWRLPRPSVPETRQ